jgi:hypothetical protein
VEGRVVNVTELYDATVRVVCDESSHREAVVATYRHFVGDGRPLAADALRWHWNDTLSYGGGRIEPLNGQRVSRDKRRATQAEIDAGLPWEFVEAGPKRVVSDGQTADVLECGKCGLRRLVNKHKLEALLNQCLEHGVSRVRLGDLVARLR